ncbi:hypothetical protein TraAM80_10395 [Trypanosoma rangeli]|uniref:F-box domain-containing protein n=1 Tax=Trypanosoma rangeli TaxID=5698 RepID=A0A422MPI6_TRYRA|nr:uncharacterized protein TraAM80_10395 [Trypanosoma rangeli]RNE95107.1 hypothetical protein TraAM80_10395 [Trypanosoma rangeli]|eukprot:RNE95107.1 hypothetical protein TraAM80_10395 [Trypanosoma rangeli]
MQGPLHGSNEPFGTCVAARSNRMRARREATGSTYAAGAGAQVPLRSRTVVAPRLQLCTYHDNAAMREALEQLKQACGLFSLDEVEEMEKMNPRHGIARSTRSQLNQMPGHMIVHCFTYCDLRSLCELGCVSRRFAALSNAQILWEAHARLRNVSVRALESAREDFRRAVVERHERWQAEVQRHEREYEALQHRLHERTAADLADPIDVDTVLASTRPRGLVGSPSSSRQAHSAAQLQELSAIVEQLESEKLELIRGIRELKSTLAQQQKQIEELQKNVAESRETDPDGGNTTTADEADGITFLSVRAFERRICRIVLSVDNDLSLVLRRGVDEFGTMELLCLYGAGDVGQRVRQRWAAFKRFFPPVSEDYGTVRSLLMTGESPSSAQARECLARLGGVIRRVQRMTDNEIVQIIL